MFLPVQCRRTCHRLRWMSIDKRRVVCLDSVDATPCGTSHRHCRDKFDCTLWMRLSRKEKCECCEHMQYCSGFEHLIELFSNILCYVISKRASYYGFGFENIWVVWLKIDFIVLECGREEVKSFVRQTWLTIESYVPRQHEKTEVSQ